MTLPAAVVPWVTEWLGAGWTAHALAGDASVRAYYRLTDRNGQSFILAYYPEEVRTQLQRSLASYDLLSAHLSGQSRLPRVLSHCPVAVLLEDAGDRTLYDVLHENREEGLRRYHDAIELLAALQQAADGGLNPPFTPAFFLAELEMARQFYVQKLMDRPETAELRVLMTTLCDNIGQHPQRLCHRDYHGQNIHVINDTLYLIDYQDIRLGPDTYDLASLLRDRGVARILGQRTELKLLEDYGALIGAGEGIRHRYFETLLQRSIKILGTFSKQPIVRGRMHYLEFIPPALESIDRCLNELPGYAPLRDMVPLDFDLDRARERAAALFAGA